LFDDCLDLGLDLGGGGRILELTTASQQTNLICQTQLTTGHQVVKSSSVVSERGVTLADKVGALGPKEEDVGSELTKEVAIAKKVDGLV
jgi:hypothetical protein